MCQPADLSNICFMGRGDGGEGVTGGLQTRAGRRGQKEAPRVVDRNDASVTQALPDAPIYKKHVQIQARQAMPGERIDTILADGRVETTNTAEEGSWIVTNPSGEEYIVGGDTFAKKYEATEKEGLFQAKGQIRAIPNPWATDISLEASWGEMQHGDQECLVVASCDKQGNIEGEPYIIDKAAFEETYIPANNTSESDSESSLKRTGDSPTGAMGRMKEGQSTPTLADEAKSPTGAMGRMKEGQSTPTLADEAKISQERSEAASKLSTMHGSAFKKTEDRLSSIMASSAETLNKAEVIKEEGDDMGGGHYSFAWERRVKQEKQWIEELEQAEANTESKETKKEINKALRSMKKRLRFYEKEGARAAKREQAKADARYNYPNL